MKTTQKQLDSYSMMITSKYFEIPRDYINMICVNSKFKETLDKFHYNPIPVKDLKLFPRMETQYLYTRNDNVITNLKHHVVWYTVNYDYQKRERNKGNTFIFKHVVYSTPITNNYINIPHSCNVLGVGTLFNFDNPTQSIIIPTNITLLNNSCFINLRNIQTISLSTSLRIIPDNCFGNCSSLKNIDLSFITSLGIGCFKNCQTLSSITITKHIEKIGYNCFLNCNSLNDIMLKEELKKLATNIPYHIAVILKQKNIECLNICYTNDDVNKYGISIPSICKKLDEYCYSNILLHSINILTNITSIGNNCFNNCNKLTLISLPTTINSLPYQCFSYCYLLKEIDISNVTTIEEKCFSYCKALTSIKLNSQIKSVPISCFCYCSSLKEIIIPTTITSIGNCCFSNCFSLSSLRLPETVKSLPNYCFLYCSSLKEIDCSFITSIKNKCFYSCENLTSITLTSNIKSIGKYSFYKSKLNSFSQFKKLDRILPNMLSDYFITKIVIPTQFTSIKQSSFTKFIELKKVTISNACKIISGNCFFGCSHLTDIKLPTSLKVLPNGFFQQCLSLKLIIIPTTVTRIGKACFSSCTSLQQIILPESIKSLHNRCFFDCISLTKVQIPKTLSSIGKNCFKKCRLLQSITISSTVQLNEPIGGYKLNVIIESYQ